MEAIVILLLVGIFLWISIAAINKGDKMDSIHAEMLDYQYSEHEFLELYNFVVRKRNAMISRTLVRDKLDKVLNETGQMYESPYYENNYNEFCKKLLAVLSNSECKEINYGKLRGGKE